MAWPTVVPILEASDICRGKFDGHGGTHCLVGWMLEAFRWPECDKVAEKLNEAFGDHEYEEDPIARFNDDKQNSKSKIAKIWNSVMRTLGYTVPCERNP